MPSRRHLRGNGDLRGSKGSRFSRSCRGRSIGRTEISRSLGADVHQPLHVVFADDRGGNQINTVGICVGSLHGAWDGCLVERTLGHDVISIATELRNEITPAQRAEWTASSPTDWANESFALVTGSIFGYCVWTPSACWYDSSNPALDPDEPLKTVLVDQAYVEAAAPVIQDRLKRAAVRLAHLLDQALGN